MLLFAGLLAITIVHSALSFTDTEHWVGAEYTPAAAPGNGYWWAWYDEYEPSVQRELPMLRKHMGLTTLRVWLMYGVYKQDPEVLHTNMGKFLDTAAASNISVGFVFFGDCFNHAGGSVSVQCTPKKGVHNGCWMASPQDAERVGANASNGYLPLKPYVTSTIKKFKDHPTVRWWEVFNEPRRDAYSLGLRNAGYEWAKAVGPRAPVISCWDDSNNTDIVDHHDYGTAFKTGWARALYMDPEKGAVVTEGGSRWYQPDPGPAASAVSNQVDQGSPLTVINFLTTLRAEKKTGKRPYVPGAIVCWEAMVGNSNTRWHWGTAPGTAEPAIPWDAWVFPDGTPISYTEVAAFRRYATDGQADDFARFDDFLPRTEHDGDVTLTVIAGSSYTAGYAAAAAGAFEQHQPLVAGGSEINEIIGCEDVAGSCMGTCPAGMGCGSNGHGCICKVAPLTDGVFETTFWASYPGDGNMTMVVRANPIPTTENRPASSNTGTRVPATVPGTERIQGRSGGEGGGSCMQAKPKMWQGTDIAGANYKGIHYRTIDVSKAAVAAGDHGVESCSAACCAWDGCAAWIVQSGTGPSKHDGNCSSATTTCCWLKPNGAGAHVPNSKSIAGVVTASPPRPVIPPPPPPPPPGLASPRNISGYHAVIVGATKTLVLERREAVVNHSPQQGGGGEIDVTILGTFDLRSLENGLVLEAWNILRVVAETVENTSGQIKGVQLSVYFNPMFSETGFVGNSSDATRVPTKLPPRLTAFDQHPLGAGELMNENVIAANEAEAEVGVSGAPHPWYRP